MPHYRALMLSTMLPIPIVVLFIANLARGMIERIKPKEFRYHRM